MSIASYHPGGYSACSGPPSLPWTDCRHINLLRANRPDDRPLPTQQAQAPTTATGRSPEGTTSTRHARCRPESLPALLQIQPSLAAGSISKCADEIGARANGTGTRYTDINVRPDRAA